MSIDASAHPPLGGAGRDSAVKPVLLFGASKGVGFELVRLLRDDGLRVVAMLRPGTGSEQLEELGVEVVRGDALNPSDIAKAFDALGTRGIVVSTLGGRVDEVRSADEHGNVAVVDEAVSRGVERFVLVTSIGCGEMLPFRSERARAAFGASVEAKTRAEDHLRRTDLPFTIIRPGGLRSEPPTGGGILTTDPEMHGFIHRADVAELILRALRDPSTERGVFAAVDEALAQSVNPIEPFPLA